MNSHIAVSSPDTQRSKMTVVRTTKYHNSLIINRVVIWNSF